MEHQAPFQLNRMVIVMRTNVLLGKRHLALVLVPFLLTACAVQTPQSAPVLSNSSPTTTPAAVVESSYGNISWVMPASWKKVIPRVWTAWVGPLVFLSNARIIDPCASSFRVNACRKPLTKLPPDGILLTFQGSAVVLPPNSKVPVKVAVRRDCQDMGGELEFVNFFHGVVIDVCLRGPDFTANEALFQQMMSSMKESSVGAIPGGSMSPRAICEGSLGSAVILDWEPGTVSEFRAYQYGGPKATVPLAHAFPGMPGNTRGAWCGTKGGTNATHWWAVVVGHKPATVIIVHGPGEGVWHGLVSGRVGGP